MPLVINWYQESASTHLKKANLFNRLVSEEVSDILSSLNIKKDMGHDEIPNIILKNCSETLCVLLSLLFRKILNKGVSPPSGKHRLSVLSTRKVTGPQLSNDGQLVSCEMCLKSSKELFPIKYMKVICISSLTTNTGSGRKDRPQCSCCRTSIKCINPTTNV